MKSITVTAFLALLAAHGVGLAILVDDARVAYLDVATLDVLLQNAPRSSDSVFARREAEIRTLQAERDRAGRAVLMRLEGSTGVAVAGAVLVGVAWLWVQAAWSGGGWAGCSPRTRGAVRGSMAGTLVLPMVMVGIGAATEGAYVMLNDLRLPLGVVATAVAGALVGSAFGWCSGAGGDAANSLGRSDRRRYTGRRPATRR